MTPVNSIAVIGSGTMGSGIAQVCAQAGLSVFLYDINEAALSKAKTEIVKNLDEAIKRGKLTEQDKHDLMRRIKLTSDFEDLKADLCIEAIIENLEVKKELMQNLALQNTEHCILASNTSSIPITQIAAHVPRPERVVGIHFFNPAHIMKLVEIIGGAETSDGVMRSAKDFVLRLNKTPVTVKDSPGFIVNRVARHYYVEALKILEENIATVKDIDALMDWCGYKFLGYLQPL